MTPISLSASCAKIAVLELLLCSPSEDRCDTKRNIAWFFLQISVDSEDNENVRRIILQASHAAHCTDALLDWRAAQTQDMCCWLRGCSDQVSMGDTRKNMAAIYPTAASACVFNLMWSMHALVAYVWQWDHIVIIRSSLRRQNRVSSIVKCHIMREIVAIVTVAWIRTARTD